MAHSILLSLGIFSLSSCYLWDAALVILILYKVTENSWLPRLPLTADAFREIDSFGCYTVKKKVQNVFCSVCNF